MSGTEHPVASALARVFDATGAVVGAGFVVGDGRVATCAHVVSAAVGGDPEASTGPIGRLSIDFPLVGPQLHSAWVQRWWPIQPDGTGDIAILQLESTPVGPRMPPMYRPEQPWGHRFRVVGFPAGMHDGVWTAGELRAKQGTRWVQLQGDPHTQPIAQGFSGGPVWDDEVNAVVGMTVAADLSPQTTTAYLVAIQDVLGVDPSLLPNPYRGLEPFDEQHAEFFYGRDEDIERLTAALERERLVAIVGRSGTGKSSLLRAGLLPRLRARRTPVTELRPGSAVPGDASGVVYVDQFEELVSQNPEIARGFLNELIAVSGRSDVRVVLTLRWEAMNELLTEDTARVFEQGTVSIAPMGRTQLREAVVGPSLRAPGLYFEDGLVERILDDAGAEPGQLPLVESLLTQLWAARRGGMLTHAAYDELGGVQGAVTRQAETAMQALSGVPTERMRRLLTMLARPIGGAEFVRRPARFDQLDADLRQVTEALVRSRLLVVDRAPDGTLSVELAHQALIDHWPRLRGWLSDDRDFLAWEQELDTQAAAWSAAGRDHGALLRGSKLAVAQEWLADRGEEIPAQHREFIKASRARQRREVRRWRIVAAALLALVVLAGVLTAVTVQNNREISANLRKANAQLLADQASAQAPLDVDRANQLAMAAYRADPNNPDVRTALAKQYLTSISVDKVFSNLAPAPIKELKSSADGSTLLLVHDKGATAVSAVDGDRPATRALQAKGILDYYLSPDGRWAIGTGNAGLLRWDLHKSGAPETLTSAAPDETVRASFSADSSRFVVVNSDQNVVIHEVATGDPVDHKLNPITQSGVIEVWLTVDEKSVLFVRKVKASEDRGEDRAVETMRLSTGRRTRTIAGRVGVFGNGTRVVMCSESSAILDAATGKRVAGKPVCDSVAIDMTADGRHFGPSIGPSFGSSAPTIAKPVYTDATDGSSFAANVPPLRHGEDDLYNNFQRATPIAVRSADPDRHWLLMPRHRSLLRVAANPSFPDLQDALQDPVPGGRYLQISSLDGTVTVLDVATGKQLGRIVFEHSATDTVFGPTTQPRRSTSIALLPSEGRTATVRQYSLPDLRPRGEVVISAPQGEPLDSLGFEQVGDRIVAVSAGQVSVWNLSTGRQEHSWTAIPRLDVEESDGLAPANWTPMARPGHPDEVVLARPRGGVLRWNVTTNEPAGKEIDAQFPDLTRVQDHLAFDRTGTVLVTADENHVGHVWDVDGARERGAGITLPESTNSILGFTDEGYFVTDDLHTLTFWNIHGKQMNTVELREPSLVGDGLSLRDLPDGDHLVQQMDKTAPIVLKATAKDWFEHLCRIQNRPFTSSEARALPAGADTEPPCAER